MSPLVNRLLLFPPSNTRDGSNLIVRCLDRQRGTRARHTVNLVRLCADLYSFVVQARNERLSGWWGG